MLVDFQDLGIRPSNSAQQNTDAWYTITPTLGQFGVPYFPPGRYLFAPSSGLNQGLVLPPGYAFRGAGQSSELVLTGDVGSPNCFIRIGSGCGARGIKLDLNGQDANGLAVFEADDCVVDDVHIRNCVDYGIWVIDYSGQANRTGVQFGNSVISNCTVEAKECFEAFYVENVVFSNCRAIGTVGIAKTAQDSLNGFLLRDEARRVQIDMCQADGDFAFSFMKATNNDRATTYEAELQVDRFRGRGTAAYGLYLLDLTKCSISGIVRALGATLGCYQGFTASDDIDCRNEWDVDCEADTGLAFRLAAGSRTKIAGRLRSAGANVMEIGTAGKITNWLDCSASIVADGDGTQRAIKFNEDDIGARFTGDQVGNGTSYQWIVAGAGATPEGVVFERARMDGVRLNTILGSNWRARRCTFRNTVGANIGTGGYINGQSKAGLQVESCDWWDEGPNAGTVVLAIGVDGTGAAERDSVKAQ